MRVYRSLVLALLCSLASCSISKFQGEGDILYTGIKDISYAKYDKQAEAEVAIQAAEEQLAYPPNNSLFGSSTMRLPLPLYRPYLHLKYADSKSGLGKWLYRLGNKPVWIRDVNPTLRAKITERVLGEYGYLRARVSPTVIPNPKDSLQARVAYHIDMGQLHHYDSIRFLPPIRLSDTTSLVHSDLSTLHRGLHYTADGLIQDRTKVSSVLRENGYYYFNPSYITYEADTLQVREQLQLRALIKEGLPSEVLRQWRIGEVRVRFVDAEDGVGQSLVRDTLSVGDRVVAYYRGKLPIRPKTLNSRVRLRPDSLYRYSQEDLTIKSLASIGTFSSTEIFYTPRTTDSLATDTTGVMDMTVLMRRDKPWSVSLGGQFVHKTTGFIGPGAVFSLNRRNLFGGGETLTLSATASYEWQWGQNPFRSSSAALNSYQLGLDASLSFPTLLIPGMLDYYWDFPTTTTFKLSGQRLNRAGYYGLNNLGLSVSYDYQPSSYTTHNIKVLGLDYSYLGYTSTAFDAVLAQNPSLSLSLTSQLIPSIGYTYTWTKKVGQRQRNTLWIRSSVSEAGNLTKALFLAFGNSFNDTQKILNVPYAQFVKANTELRYTRYIDRYQSLSTRLSLGAIYSYGNMKYAPYIEQFYVGGASSIRAFTVRSLGPGKFKETASSSYTFMDHVGDLKFEANMEFRRKLIGSLELALFLDAGNIWLLRTDADRPGGSITEVQGIGDFLNQIAVGTGLGLRYDVGYLLLRVDAGIGLHLPYETTRKGWYNIPKFADGFGLHLAIGYPF